MKNWIKLAGIALVATSLFLLANEFVFSKQKPKDSAVDTNAQIKTKEGAKAPATKNSTGFLEKKPSPSPSPTSFAFGGASSSSSATNSKIPPRPESVNTSGGGSSSSGGGSSGGGGGGTGGGSGGGGGGTGGGGSGGGGSGGGGTTASSTNSSTNAGSSLDFPPFFLEQDDTTYNGCRHNNTCVRFQNYPGVSCEATDGIPCPLCGG